MRVPLTLAALACLVSAAGGTFCAGVLVYEQAVSQGCTSIGGSLFLTSIQTASPERLELSSLGGDPVVASNPALASLSGLRVQHVNGNVAVSGNPVLATLDALAGTNISGDAPVDSNVELSSRASATRRRQRVSLQLGSTLWTQLSFCTYTATNKDGLKTAIAVYVSDPVG